MDVSVFGLGYVGTVCAACLSRRGHQIVGCDVQRHKVAAINNGISPIEEPGLPALIKESREVGRLTATTDPAEAVRNSMLTFVCVGTPSNGDGSINLSYLKAVCKEIGESIAKLGRPHTVVIRSTVLPEALDQELLPLLEESVGANSSELLRFCVNPEFMRESSAVTDFDNPPMIVIGESQPGAGDALVALYEGIETPIFRMGLKEAVMVKYASNIFHALKIIFGNEIGALCQSMGIDSHQVMEVFCQDRQLNISHRYLKPGYAYGGSCLPKDLRAMLYVSRQRNVETTALSTIERSNQSHIEQCLRTVLSNGARKIGVLGLSFKDDTDDLRESPTVEIVERLIGKGFTVRIHDKDVSASRIFGSNLTFIQQHLPHVASLMCSTPEETIRDSEVILLAKPSRLYAQIAESLRPNQTLVDLVRFFNPKEFTACRYISLVG